MLAMARKSVPKMTSSVSVRWNVKTSRPQHLCLFSKVVRRCVFPVFFPVTVVQCLQSDSCHYWHCNRSFFLLAHLLTLAVTVVGSDGGLGGEGEESDWLISVTTAEAFNRPVLSLYINTRPRCACALWVVDVQFLFICCPLSAFHPQHWHPSSLAHNWHVGPFVRLYWWEL